MANLKFSQPDDFLTSLTQRLLPHFMRGRVRPRPLSFVM